LVADELILDIADGGGVGEVGEVTDPDGVLAQDVETQDVAGDGDGAVTEEVGEVQEVYLPNCPNGSCDPEEDKDNCPADCCSPCGDGTCTTCLHLNETAKICPQDCCNDGNLCTDDISILADGVYICSHVVNDLANCEVDLPCTTGDYCEGGLCVAGDQEALCDDESLCTSDWCDQATGGCHFEPDTGSDFDDGDLCKTADKCELGECQPGPLDDCDDGNQCTADACLNVEPIVGCVNQPKVDGISCNKDPCRDSVVCEDGKCVCD
jgi:hypothetical protein